MVRVGRDEHVARHRVLLCLGACTWLIALLLPLGAAAQTVTGAARVTTMVDACVPIDIEQFHRLLAIELGTSIQYSPDAAQAPDGATVRVSCGANAIDLSLSDSVTRKSMTRSVELPQVEIAARTRLLALTVAEFVVASWVELQLAQPPIEPVGPRVAPEVTQRATQAARQRLPVAPPAAVEVRWLLGASGDLLLFSGGLLPQLSLHAELRPLPALSVGVAFGVAHGSWDARWPSVSVGKAQLTSSSGRAGLAYVTGLGPVELQLGAGARLGLVHMAGWSSQIGVVAVELYAPWGGPVLQASASLHFLGFRAGVELEGGYVTLPVQALINKAAVVAELRGLFGGVSLRLGWLF